MQYKSLYILLPLLGIVICLQAQFDEKVFGKTTETSGDLKEAISSYQKAVTGNNKNEIVANLAQIGNIYYTHLDYSNAIQSFQKAIVLYDELKNHSGTADMLINISGAYRDLSDFPHLLEYLQKATREYEKASDEVGLAKTLRSTGYYYLNLSEFPTAVTYFQKSLALYKKLDNQKEVANLLGDLGHSYLLIRDSVNALTYLQQALSLNQKIGNKQGMAKNYWILGDYYFRISSDVAKALDFLQESLSLFEETNNKIGVGQVFINLSDVYNASSDSALKKAGIPPAEKYARSIEYSKKGLQIFKEFLPESEQLITLSVLGRIYQEIGKFDTACYYFQQYIILRDKIISAGKEKEIARLETKYEYEKKEDSLKLQQELTDEKLAKQLLLFKQQHQQLELNQSQLALANKEKDLQKLAYLKTQADLQNEQLEKQKRNRELKIAQNEKQLQESQVKNLSQQQALSKLKLQQQWIYSIAILVLLGLFASYFIYRNRIKEVRLKEELAKEKAEQEKKEAQFQRNLADISLSALRSQMNPHFIFNCLNSIKLYTTQNDTTAATEYLSKFSKLIRLVMENSRNDRITLRSELDALQLYIEMEVMRFKEKLAYTINVNDNVETDYIEIPPLLLQPYVENAIWHGLMHKEAGGRIDINVSMQKNESLLEISIVDNGIGRARSAELRSKTATKHKSYGMKVTSERIALINQIYRTGANVAIHDLIDAEGQPGGTEVTIQIPV